MLTRFFQLPIPLPPMLLEMMGYRQRSRYVGLYYLGSKATWDDGRSVSTFSFYSCWEPLISHFALELDLIPFHLGSDDMLPTHAILCDRAEAKLYVGDHTEVLQFLEAQHPPLEPISPDHLRHLQDGWEVCLSMPDMQRLGMFEQFYGASPEQQQQVAGLVEWLDQFISEALVERYTTVAKFGNPVAIIGLSKLQRRIEATISAHEQRGQ